MSDTDNFALVRRTPWNKGKLIGARPPLRSKHVWSVRTRLQVEGRVRDLACSILPSIASFGAAMLWRSRSRLAGGCRRCEGPVVS